MRYSREHKQAMRQRIIEAAGRRFKTDGGRRAGGHLSPSASRSAVGTREGAQHLRRDDRGDATVPPTDSSPTRSSSKASGTSSRWCTPKVRPRATGQQSAARANRLTPTPPGARQPDDETGTDPVMPTVNWRHPSRGRAASAPAQRHHESTTIIWSAAWLGRSPSSRAPPGDRQFSAKEHAAVLDALFEHLIGDLRVGHNAGHLQRPHRYRVEPERLRAR